MKNNDKIAKYQNLIDDEVIATADGSDSSPSAFDYSQLDSETAEFLKEKEANIRNIANELATRAGKELYDAQQRLAGNNQYNGLFQKWCKGVGFNNQQHVNNLINRFLLIKNFDDHNYLEALPNSLLYEAGSSSAPEVLKQAVIEGDISTHKEYQQLKMMLEQEKEKAEITINELKSKVDDLAIQSGKAKANELTIKELKEKLEEKEKQLSSKNCTIQTLMNKPPKVEYRNSPEILDQLSQKDSELRNLNSKLGNLEAEIEEARKIKAQKKQIKNMMQQIDEIKKQKSEAIQEMQNLQEVFRFITKTKEFIKKEMLHIPTLVIPNPDSSQVVNNEINNICDVLENYVFALKQKFIK